MAEGIPATTIHLVLQSLKSSSGPHYEQILADAGMTRFLDNLPPLGWQPVATRDEFSRMFAAVYERLGESLTRNFLRTWGQMTAQGFLQTEDGKAMLTAAARVPEKDKLAWFAKAMADLSAQAWSTQTLEDAPDAWYFTMDDCPICRHVRGAGAPLCTDVEGLYGAIARQVFGRRLRIAEVACVATGAPRCRFAYYKD
jgi:bacteriochlorophyll 4-vinyl reductase